MSYIELDYNVLGSTVGSARNCVSTLTTQKNLADNEIVSLGSSWQGQDATDFYSRWDETKSSDSNYEKLKYAVNSFSNYIDYCKANYK